VSRFRFPIIFAVIILVAVAYYFISTDRTSDMELIGTIDANQVIVSSQIQGRIVRLLVDDGTQVKKGDLIAVLDTAELEAQKRAAEATLASLREQVGGARHNLLTASGQTLSDVANSQARLQSTRAQLAQAQATLQQIELDTKRTVALAEQGVASQQDKDRATAQLAAQEAAVRSLEDQVNAAAADLTAAKARMNNAAAAQSTVAATQAQMINTQAMLAQADTRLGYTNIYAPVSGTVSVRAAREGEVVNPGSAIVTLIDYGDTWAYAAIPETYADKVRLGDKLKVRMPSGQIVNGAVILKAAEGDFATQRDVSRRKRDIKTVGMRVRIQNDRGEFVPGMTAEVLVPQSMLAGDRQAAQDAEKR
jgi:multidrug resistance efflux pump